MMTYVHLWQYVAEFFLEYETFSNVIKKIKNHFLCLVIFSPENLVFFLDNVEKHGGARRATDDNIWGTRFACRTTRVTKRNN